MKIEELKKIVRPLITGKSIKVEFDKIAIEATTWKKDYNKIIRNYVDDRFGVYVWIDKRTEEIVYIGMAGKTLTDGSHGGHSLRKRLQASRGRKKNKHIQTNEYIQSLKNQMGIDSLDIIIMYSKDKIPPAYVESFMLYNFYKATGKLPKLNKSF